MLKLLAFALILFLPTLGSSQFNYAVKVGYSTSLTETQLVRYDDAEDYVIYNITHKNILLTPNINVSMMYQDKKSNLFVQGDISYRQEHHVFEIKSDILTDIRTFEEKKIHRFINIPFVGGFASEHFKFGLGPQVSFLISDNKAFDELLYFEEERKIFETAFIVQVGYMVSDFFVELNYEYHTNGAVDNIEHRGMQRGFGLVPKYLNLNVGWYFNRYR